MIMTHPAVGQPVKASRFCTPIITKALTENITNSTTTKRDIEGVYLALELTRQCNLHCRHCYVAAAPGVKDHHYVSRKSWLACLADAQHLGIPRVQFIGGEPTTHPLLPTLMEHARLLAFCGIELYSNATRLNAKLFDSMRQNKVSLATSLYGASAELHDRFTGVDGSFARTRDNIEHAVSLGIPVRVAVIRYEHEGQILDEAYEVARRLGVLEVSIDVVRAFGRGRRRETWAAGCDACGVAVLRVCSDGTISGCAMAREPKLGHIDGGLEPALKKLADWV